VSKTTSKVHTKQASGSVHKHMIFNIFLGSFGILDTMDGFKIKVT